ncbi:ATP-binding cassette domain-containing protein [Aurantimonas sp. MSK8Z-1]|uniref:ABC transporter ATP-binding protein n=1 Tax=Mangrovibrevibacter kandeliae TaxID=2968473 RepID=UPI002117658A|nr:ATP-binding cassette domain-containing protein [Aurantimonas sp. MSK8Z-1]MCW4113947.1 ATP-binding cassette domain-containing protein [Aurantimonas sp. MSK8Z-1]
MSNPSKPVPRAGASGPLDVRIDSKVYRAADGTRLTAIDALAFMAAAGSFTALIGPSGSGKTTTLRIILGLDADYAGHVVLPRPDARVAAVFQEPRLLPWRSVEENVRLALPPDRIGAELGPLFDTLGLADHRTRYPGELSLGLARRAALARAFAVEPDVLLLDEPFVSLDEMTAGRLRVLLAEVWAARPTTALMVTHNLREAVELADRILFLTERPARLRGSVELATPRSGRDAAWREARLREIDAAFPGIL